MKKAYQTMEVSVAMIQSNDVIRTSNGKDPWENEPSEWGIPSVVDLNL